MVQGPGVGRDCAIFHVEGKNQMAASIQSVTAEQPERVRHLIYHTANNLLCGGAAPGWVLLSVLLPAEAEETLLREIMDTAARCCQELGIALAGGHTEVSEAVRFPVVTASGMGVTEDECVKAADVHPGLDLVMTGWAGTEGTAILARREEQRLLTRFPLDLVEQAKGFDRDLSVERAVKTALSCGCGAAAFHDISQGGVFGALWELCESAGTGMEGELKKIPLKQETVEICEMLGLNPYCLLSGGALLAAVKDGQRLVTELSREGIPAVLIGRTTETKDKVLWNGEERRFLEKPAQDEILK